jgi:hypothetical protein
MFKDKLQLEPYLLKLSFPWKKNLTKFRISNHKLPIEKDRYAGIPRNERVCSECDCLGDEYHYILNCRTFRVERKQLLAKYYYVRPSAIKFGALFSITNIQKLIKLSKFVKIIMDSIN